MAGSAGKSKTYTLRVGRRGKEAWLAVEGLKNVTGQAVGSMTQLDVSPVLYIGKLPQRSMTFVGCQQIVFYIFYIKCHSIFAIYIDIKYHPDISVE